MVRRWHERDRKNRGKEVLGVIYVNLKHTQTFKDKHLERHILNILKVFLWGSGIRVRLKGNIEQGLM